MRRRHILGTGLALAVVLSIAATAAVADPSAVTASVPRVVFSNADRTAVVEQNGTNWRQLNECTFSPIDIDGNRLLGVLLDADSNREELLLLPASKEVVGECDNGPSDPVRRKYRLRVPGAHMLQWDSMEWSPDGRRVLIVEFRRGYSPFQPARAAVFNANGKGFRLVGPRGVTTAAWSPTGDRIVYGRTFKVADCPENEAIGATGLCVRNEIAVMKSDGSGVRSIYYPDQLDPFVEVDDLPAGSPLRKLPSSYYYPFAWHRGKIFLTVNSINDVSIGSDRIAVINEDGTGFRYLTPRASNLTGRPALSPDGKQIAVIWEPGTCSEPRSQQVKCRGEHAVYVIPSSGGPQRKLKVRFPLVSQTCAIPGIRPGKCSLRSFPYDPRTRGYAGVTWMDR